jgi:hypothetical protein
MKTMKNFAKPGLFLALALLAAGIPPFINSPAFGQKAGANPAVPYATAVPKPIDLKSAPVTHYSLLDNHPLVTWDTLAHFAYDAPELDEEIDPRLRQRRKKYPIPGFIKQLDGQAIAVVGFMIPIDTNETGDKATSFILARSQATCCYGIIPKLNEWMFVKMGNGKDTDAVMDVPVTVFGTLSVGEQNKKDMGWSLYRMAADKVRIPKSSNW